MLAQRSINVETDVWAKLKDEAEKLNKNVTTFASEILADHVYKNPGTDRNVKGILLAAGMASRMMELTDEKPKCMLEVNGKTLLQRQVNAFKSYNVNDLVVVRGYKKEAVNYADLKYYYDYNYRRGNILHSLMVAEPELNQEFIVSYTDILFKKEIVGKLLESKADIAIIVDADWNKFYEGQLHRPAAELEKVTLDGNYVIKLGKNLNPNNTQGEFIGIAKFSKAGAEALKAVYADLKTKLGNSPFQAAPSLEKAYLTDMLQELVDRGYKVEAVLINGGWLELDDKSDFFNAQQVWTD